MPDADWQELASRWRPWLAELLEGWRVVRASVGDRNYWIASERAKEFALIYPDAKFEVAPPELPSNAASRDDALLSMVRGWVMHSGPTSATALAILVGFASFGSDRRSAADGGQRVGAPREFHWASRRDRARYDGMVRSAAAGADSPPNGRHAAQAGRTGDCGAVHALAAALATCCAQLSTRRRARTAGGRATVAGIRDSGERMGKAGAQAARQCLRSGDARPACA